MKNIRSWLWTSLFILAILGLIIGSVTLSMAEIRQPIKEITTKVYQSDVDEDKSLCVHGYTDNDKCLLCHTSPNNKLQEADPDEGRNYPSFNMVVRNDIGYYRLENISPVEVWKFFDYLKFHKINKAVIEIMSPGGSLFDAWTIISYMAKFEGTVETRVRSFAASAGCLIFVGGDVEKRFVDPTAMLMWHELWTFKFLSIETPTSTEDEAKVLRKIQDTINKWLAARTKLAKEKIDEKVKRKEFWFDGEEAVEFGFADGFIK